MSFITSTVAITPAWVAWCLKGASERGWICKAYQPRSSNIKLLISEERLPLPLPLLIALEHASFHR
jgi:hypothetical protein